MYSWVSETHKGEQCLGDIMSEESEAIESTSEEDILDDFSSEPIEEEEVTIWAPEPSTSSDDVVNEPVDSWIEGVEFESTRDVPIPENLVDQVIGQEAGSVVIRKAAEQRRHMLMIGDPGTGKSMLARSMTAFLPRDQLEDVLVYPNEDDENDNKRTFKCVACKYKDEMKEQEKDFEEPKCTLCSEKGGVLLESFAKPVSKMTFWKQNPKLMEKTLFGQKTFAHYSCAL